MSDVPNDPKTRTMREHIDEAADTVTETARAEVDKAASRAADRAGDEAQSVADAAAAASAEFDAGSLQERATAEIAAHLQSAAANLRATDLEGAAAGVSRFARENPALFLGGAALLGFAAGRFLKSSAPVTGPRHTAASDDDPWTGYATATPTRSAAEPMPAPQVRPSYSNGRADV